MYVECEIDAAVQGDATINQMLQVTRRQRNGRAVVVDWTNLILNPKTIESFYSRAPSLLGVRILEVVLQEDGPTLCLRLDLNDFPDKVPKKWLASGFNHAQIRMRFSGILSLDISGWATDNIVDIVIEKISEGISLKAKGARTRIEGICLFVDVEGVTGYVKGD